MNNERKETGVTRIVAALFPDRAAAQQALQTLSTAGFAPKLDEDGRLADLQGFVVTSEVQNREADLRDLLMHAGATSLQGRGADWPGHGGTTTGAEEPIPVRHGERLPPSEPAPQEPDAAAQTDAQDRSDT